MGFEAKDMNEYYMPTEEFQAMEALVDAAKDVYRIDRAGRATGRLLITAEIMEEALRVKGVFDEAVETILKFEGKKVLPADHIDRFWVRGAWIKHGTYLPNGAHWVIIDDDVSMFCPLDTNRHPPGYVNKTEMIYETGWSFHVDSPIKEERGEDND